MLNIGVTELTKIMVGTTQITKVMYGTDLIWPNIRWYEDFLIDDSNMSTIITEFNNTSVSNNKLIASDYSGTGAGIVSTNTEEDIIGLKNISFPPSAKFEYETIAIKNFNVSYDFPTEEDQDVSKTFTGLAPIELHITGEAERRYDEVYVYDETDTEIAVLDDKLDDYFTINGTTCRVRYVTDYSNTYNVHVDATSTGSTADTLITYYPLAEGEKIHIIKDDDSIHELVCTNIEITPDLEVYQVDTSSVTNGEIPLRAYATESLLKMKVNNDYEELTLDTETYELIVEHIPTGELILNGDFTTNKDYWTSSGDPTSIKNSQLYIEDGTLTGYVEQTVTGKFTGETMTGTIKILDNPKSLDKDIEFFDGTNLMKKISRNSEGTSTDTFVSTTDTIRIKVTIRSSSLNPGYIDMVGLSGYERKETFKCTKTYEDLISKPGSSEMKIQAELKNIGDILVSATGQVVI